MPTYASTQQRIATIKRGRMILKFGVYPEIVRAIKMLGVDHYRFSDTSMQWSLKITLRSLKLAIDYGFRFSAEDEESIKKVAAHLLTKEKVRQQREKYANALSADIIPQLAALMREPACPYQWVSVHYARLADGKFLLADDMGVGKTVQALMISMAEPFNEKPSLFITPVPHRFQKDLFRFFGKYSHPITKHSNGFIAGIKHYTCTDYNLQYLFEERIAINKEGQEIKTLEPKEWTKNFNVFVDEIHREKNQGTKRRYFIRKLMHQSDVRIGMTGTPMPNRAEEIFDILTLIDPAFMSWFNFNVEFCGLKRTDQGLKKAGNVQLGQLNKWLYANLMVRREFEQIEEQLPEKIRETVELYQTPLEVTAQTIFEMFSETARIKANDKVFLAWIEELILSGKKIGIFAYHKVMFEALEKVCQKLGVKYCKIDGSVNREQRARYESLFKSDPALQVIMLQQTAASVGLDLQGAHFCVHAEGYWVPSVMVQAEARFYRKGIKNALHVLMPIVTRFEYRLAIMLLEKLVNIKRVMSVDHVPDSVDDKVLLKELSEIFQLPTGMPTHKK